MPNREKNALNQRNYATTARPRLIKLIYQHLISTKKETPAEINQPGLMAFDELRCQRNVRLLDIVA